MFSRARLVAFQMVRAWKGAEVGRGIAGNKAEMKYGGSNKRLSKRGAMFTPRETMQDCGVVRGTRVIPPGKRGGNGTKCQVSDQGEERGRKTQGFI